MTKRKAEAQNTTSAPTQLSFLTASTDKRKSRMVSIRLDEALYVEFQQAAEQAAAAGYELSMTHVVHRAIRMALDEAYSLAANTERTDLGTK